MNISKLLDRRNFIKSTAVFTSGTFGLAIVPEIIGAKHFSDERESVIGPRDGF